MHPTRIFEKKEGSFSAGHTVVAGRGVCRCWHTAPHTVLGSQKFRMKTKQSEKQKDNGKRIHSVLERALDSWERGASATTNPVPLKKRWSTDEPEAILDYLHGDTPTREVKACCYYEHARASETLRRMRPEILRNAPQSVLSKVRRKYDPANAEDLLRWIGGYIPAWLQDWRSELFICPGYPKLPWRDLSGEEQKSFVEHFVKTKPPLLTRTGTQSFILNKRGIFDRFKQQAMADEHEWRDKPGLYPAMVGDNQIKYVALPLDYAQGKDAMKEAFSLWLDSEANKKLFKKYYKKPIHKRNPDSPDRYKELLKYLAAWRLYDELGSQKAKEWTRKNRRQKTHALRLRPFFREKPIKKLNVSPLYKDRRQWDDAISRAKSFLATEIERGSGMT
jgi:hypothetical protein